MRSISIDLNKYQSKTNLAEFAERSPILNMCAAEEFYGNFCQRLMEAVSVYNIE